MNHKMWFLRNMIALATQGSAPCFKNLSEIRMKLRIFKDKFIRKIYYQYN